MHVYAHRGASIECPENTLASFARALELRPTGIELDLHLSADGVPVVIHDDTVDRTTNGAGPVSSLTVAQLQALDAGDGEYVPTLEEVFDLVDGFEGVEGDSVVHMILEVKDAEVVPALLSAIKSRPNLHWSILSFNWEALREIRMLDATAELWISNFGTSDMLRVFRPETPSLKMIDEALDIAREIDAATLAVYHDGLNPETVARIHDEKRRIWAWTVNDAERMTTLASWGVDAVCTDNPRLGVEMDARLGAGADGEILHGGSQVSR